MENKIDSKTLAIEIAKVLDKKKAQDVRVLKVESLTVLTDYFRHCFRHLHRPGGCSGRQVEYSFLRESTSTRRLRLKNWVLDYSSVIVHLL